jgi:hypothetical protein
MGGQARDIVLDGEIAVPDEPRHSSVLDLQGYRTHSIAEFSYPTDGVEYIESRWAGNRRRWPLNGLIGCSHEPDCRLTIGCDKSGMETELARYDAARRALSEARSVDDVREILNLAEAQRA